MANHSVGYDAGGNALDFTTLATAFASGSVSHGDTLQVYYSSATQGMNWYEDITSAWSGKALSITGMIDGLVFRPATSSYTAYWLSVGSYALSHDIVFENLNITGNRTIIYTSGDTGGTYKLIFRRCTFFGADYYGLYLNGRVQIQVENCLFFGIVSPIYLANSAVHYYSVYAPWFYNNTFISCHRTLYHSADNGKSLWVNNLSLGNTTTAYGGTSAVHANSDYNATGDTSGPGTHAVHNVTFADANLYVTDANNGSIRFSPLLAYGSSLSGQGVAIGGITTDFSGETRPDPPSIGASEIVTILDPDTIIEPVGDYHEATTGEVESGVAFGPDQSYTGTLTPGGGQSTTPSGLTVTDSGDGFTWDVATTGAAANAAIYVYNHSGDALITIVDADGGTDELTGGQSVYIKALENNKTLSDRYPSATGVSVPALASPSVPGTPTVTAVDNEDGTGATITIADSDSGSTNKIYTLLQGASTWVLQDTITGDGVSDISLAVGNYWAKCESTGPGGTTVSAVVEFVVTNPANILQPEEAFRKVLMDDSGVTALVSTRVYAQQATFGGDYPLVVYNRITSEYLEKTTGMATDKIANVSIQVDIFGKGYSSAKATAKAIRNALNAYSGIVTNSGSSLDVRRIRLTNEIDGFEDPKDGDLNGVCRVTQEYELWFIDA